MSQHNVAIAYTNYGGAAPGVTRFYLTNASLTALTVGEANSALFNVGTLYSDILAQTPDTVDYTFDPIIECMDDATGEVVSDVTASTVPAEQVGTDTGNYASGVGIRIVWTTAARFRSRPVKGGAMLVPLSGGSFGTNGNLTTAAHGTIAASAANYIGSQLSAGLYPVVYTRHKLVTAKYPASAGFVTDIGGSLVGLIPAVLRRRRV